MPRAVTYAEWLGRTFEQDCAILRAEYPKGRLPNGYTTSDADLAVLWAAGENAHRIIQARERREEREAAADAQPSLFGIIAGGVE